MYIPEKMKLNKFRNCAIPSNKEYFSRFGFAVTPDTQYTGDEMAAMPMNKVESIEDMQAYAEMKQREIDNSNSD